MIQFIGWVHVIYGRKSNIIFDFPDDSEVVPAAPVVPVSVEPLTAAPTEPASPAPLPETPAVEGTDKQTESFSFS